MDNIRKSKTHTNMKLRELKRLVDFHVNNLQEHQDPNVCIKVKGSGAGATPTVNVKHASLGFDWDSGKFILKTTETLTINTQSK